MLFVYALSECSSSLVSKPTIMVTLNCEILVGVSIIVKERESTILGLVKFDKTILINQHVCYNIYVNIYIYKNS